MKATDVLKLAITAVEEGTAKHGDTKRSFDFVAQMWSVYIAHTMAQRKKIELTGFDVANMMVMLKQARSVYGHLADNHVDAAGYAAIAATLSPMGEFDKDFENEIAKEIKRPNQDGAKAPV